MNHNHHPSNQSKPTLLINTKIKIHKQLKEIWENNNKSGKNDNE
jgi:hypothetical protein